MSRALRRHHRERLKKARRNYWCYGLGTRSGPMPEAQQGMIVDTPTPCSCLGCGYDRKDHGITHQERRLFQDLKED